MRLTALLLTVACIQVSASSYEQTVSFSGKDVPLTDVFKSIERQTGISFFFNYKSLRNVPPVTLDIYGVKLETALDIILKPRGLDFFNSGKTVFIIEIPKHQSQFTSFPNTINKLIDITGRVNNQQGEPLAGASVIIRSDSKNRSTLTDHEGLFSIRNVSSDALLEISYTGYQKKEILINGQNSLNVTLSLANNILDEVKVIAYGTTTERFSTGDVTTIKAEDIESQPVKNPLLALEGRVPGLIVNEYNGVPGSGVTVRLMGQNSIANGNDPLYIVDGVPYTSQMISNLGNTILGSSGGPFNGQESGSGSPLSFLNPSDIESISVLKDADATAIYGSRAANGAILITTKKGKPGKAKIELNLQQGIEQVAHFMPLMNTQQYLQMRLEALTNDNVLASPTRDYDLLLWDTTRNTNWQKTLIGNAAQYTNLEASMSGGTLLAQYLVGVNYQRQSTVFPGDFSDQKGSAHLNISSASVNEKFHTAIAVNYFLDNNRLPTTDLTTLLTHLAPDAPSLYNSDKSLNWALNSAGSSTWTNPLSYNYITYTSKVNNLITTATLSYQIIRGLEVRSNFGYTNLQQSEVKASPLIAIPPQLRPNRLRSANYASSNINSWIVEPQINYKRALGSGMLDALVGITAEQHNSTDQTVNGSGYNSDAVLQNVGSATSVTGSSLEYVYKYNAIFGRVNYNWEEKYILDFSVRRDGSSRFGPANEFHDFSSGGIGWIFSEEKFIKSKMPWTSFGKLRLSYGSTGNDQIGNYNFLSLYNPINPGVPYQGTSGLLPAGLPNPNLQWEETRKLQFGIDLGFVGDRILLNLDFYRNRSSNQLLYYILPINAGFSGIASNLNATTQNSGLELSINTINIKAKNFIWSTSFNITTLYNKLLAFANLANSPYSSSFVIGKPFMGLKALYKLAGVNDTTGEYQFYTSKNALTYTPSYTDQIDTVYLAPKPFGGLNNKFVYKGIELNIFLQFVEQIAFNNFAATAPGAFGYNQPTYLLNRWRFVGDNATHQKYNENYSIFSQNNFANSSNAAYSNAAYVRIKNVSISWQMPKKVLTLARLQSCRIYLQGQNLFTFTKYKGGLDPESQGFSLPPLRVITAGLQVGL